MSKCSFPGLYEESDLDPRTLSFMVLRQFPAFGGEKGYWSKYEELEKDGVDAVLIGSAFAEVFEEEDGDVIIGIDLYFDPSLFSTEKYGLIYGDEEFLKSVQYWADIHLAPKLGRTFTVNYTEQGMQTDEYVSLEATVKVNP